MHFTLAFFRKRKEYLHTQRCTHTCTHSASFFEKCITSSRFTCMEFMHLGVLYACSSILVRKAAFWLFYWRNFYSTSYSTSTLWPRVTANGPNRHIHRSLLAPCTGDIANLFFAQTLKEPSTRKNYSGINGRAGM